jgi:hypothetical protein
LQTTTSDAVSKVCRLKEFVKIWSWEIDALIPGLDYALLLAGVSVAEDAPLLATWLTMSKTDIVFVYGG